MKNVCFETRLNKQDMWRRSRVYPPSSTTDYFFLLYEIVDLCHNRDNFFNVYFIYDRTNNNKHNFKWIKKRNGLKI